MYVHNHNNYLYKTHEWNISYSVIILLWHMNISCYIYRKLNWYIMLNVHIDYVHIIPQYTADDVETWVTVPYNKYKFAGHVKTQLQVETQYSQQLLQKSNRHIMFQVEYTSRIRFAVPPTPILYLWLQNYRKSQHFVQWNLIIITLASWQHYLNIT